MNCYKQYKLLKSQYYNSTRQPHCKVTDGLESRRDYQLNQRRISDAHFAWLCITEDVMIQAGLSDQVRRAKLRLLHGTLLERNIVEIMAVSKGAYDLLIELLSGKTELVGEIAPYSEFKALLTDFESSCVSAILAPIRQPLTQVLDHLTPSRSNGLYRSSVCVEVKLCAQYLTFLKKLELARPELRDKAIADYRETEQLNALYSVDSKDDDLLFIQQIIAAWFAEFRVNWDYAKHGPGSVADCSTLLRSEKNWALLGSKRLDVVFSGNEVFLGDKSETEEVNPTMGIFKELLSIKGLKATSKLTCVPKDASKLRTISMEPATLQFLQQAIKGSLYEYIATHEVGDHIHIKDQSFNRAYAYDGSLQNNFATLDLSHASDSVTMEFVCQAFKKVPYLRRLMVLTRSTHTEIDGELIPLKKFAPMGSALCFPIESILFAAIAARAVQLGIKRGLLLPGRNNRNYWSVFGDDTIVPVEVADIAISLLQKFGFTVNELKSYPTGPFKESCGGNFYCGVDITGIKYNPCHSWTRRIFSPHLCPTAYQSLIAYANQAQLDGYKVFRCFCLDRIKMADKVPLFTSDLDDSSAIHSSAATNFRATLDYDFDLMIWQWVFDGVTPVEVKNSNDDFYRYYISFLRKQDSSLLKCHGISRDTRATKHQRMAWKFYTFEDPSDPEGEYQDDRAIRYCQMRREVD